MKNRLKKNSALSAIESVEGYRNVIIGGGTIDAATSVENITDSESVQQLLSRLNDEERVRIGNDYLNTIDINFSTGKLRTKLNVVKRRRRRGIALIASSIAAAIFVVSFHIYNKKNDIKLINEVEVVATHSRIIQPVIIDVYGDIEYLQTNSEEKSSSTIAKRDKKREKKVINKLNQVIVPVQYVGNYTLSDGTVVTLNAGSSISFPDIFDGENREVTLTGEAYFKVKKGKKPFIVNCNGNKVRVYGTEFNVRTRKNKNFETVLVSGSVGVTAANDAEVKIEPNQLFSYDVVTKKHIVKNVNVANYINWRSNEFVYVDAELSDIFEDIEQWYGVEIQYDEDIVKDKQIDIRAKKPANILDILYVIEDVAMLTIVNEGNNIYTVTKKE